MAQSLATILAVATVTFLLLALDPADPARQAAGRAASAQQIEAVRHALGLDRGLAHRYLAYLWHLAHGDLGTSTVQREPVARLIAGRLPATLELLAGAIVCELAIGVPAGLIAASRPRGAVDRVVTGLSFLAASIPPFVIGLVLLLVFAFRLHWFPVGGGGGPAHLVLPSLTLGLVGGAWYGRVLRGSLVEAMRQDFIEALRTRGAGRARRLLVHGLRNAGLPMLAMLGTDLGAFASGAVVVETVFGWPGIGQLTWQAIQRQDVPVIMAVTLLASVAIVLANASVDLLAPLVDPRAGGRAR